MSTPSDGEALRDLAFEAEVNGRRQTVAVTVGTSTEPESIADPQREENVEPASHDNPGRTKEQRSFGGLSPQEAGRRSAQARRERALAQDADVLAQSSGKVILVRVPVQVGDIISRLASDAKKGQTHAARELRAYLDAYPAEDETDVSALDRRTRQSLLARLLAEIEEDEGEAPDAPLPS